MLRELPKCDTETQSEQMLLKMVLIGLVNAEMPQNFNL